MTQFRALLVGLGQISCGYDDALLFVLDQPRCRCAALARQLCGPVSSICGLKADSSAGSTTAKLSPFGHAESRLWGAAMRPYLLILSFHTIGLEHYQFEVMEALHRHLRDPGEFP